MDTQVVITRQQKQTKQTLGKLDLFTNVRIWGCVTLELPWLNNKKKISCIPTGEYDCRKVPATAKIPYEHILILNVPDRHGCCIHIANYYTQIEGCVAVGLAHIDINGDGVKDVNSSGKAFSAFMALVPNKFKLKIQ